MDSSLKKIKYLQCTTKHRVDRICLQQVTDLTIKSGLTESQDKPKNILMTDELNELLSHNQLLISISRPIINKVFDSLTDTTKMIFMCDEKGFIIDIANSPEILQWCYNRGIMLGSCLDYYSFGTNSISMAIYNNSPVVIFGEEHYCDAMKTWNCIAWPIRIGGKTIGILNISAQVSDNLVQLIPLVELMAEMIEIKIIYYHPASANSEKYIDKELFFGRAIINSGYNLTKKEIEILYKVYTGQKYNEIIKDLNISRNTLKTHVKNIYNKLRANSVTECIASIINP